MLVSCHNKKPLMYFTGHLLSHLCYWELNLNFQSIQRYWWNLLMPYQETCDYISLVENSNRLKTPQPKSWLYNKQSALYVNERSRGCIFARFLCNFWMSTLHQKVSIKINKLHLGLESEVKFLFRSNAFFNVF